MLVRSQSPSAGSHVSSIVDYDSQGYDYRDFWHGKEYEQWSEARVLRRLIGKLGRPHWFVDFGGGFGRNAEHYRQAVEHAVLVDYSVTNLERAAELHREQIAAGRMHLVRSDLNALPFVDYAFDAAMVVRVLHHLPQVEQTLAEMGRTVGRRWIIDVPIKHHLYGRVRAAMTGELRDVRSAQPRVTGVSDFPFYNYRLDVIRAHLSQEHWQTELVASVNNFRRWDRRLPRPAVRALRPVVYSLESVAQVTGRGWWGPSQFLLGRRRPARSAIVQSVTGDPRPQDAPLAGRMQCPSCRGELLWGEATATCQSCTAVFSRRGAFWDFVAG